MKREKNRSKKITPIVHMSRASIVLKWTKIMDDTKKNLIFLKYFDSFALIKVAESIYML